jgi:glycosyltransferase involved in cell wall biosynthesis
MKIVLSHPTGNPFTRGILFSLQSNNMLHSFHTSVACFENSLLEKVADLVPFFIDFKKRSFPTEIRRQTVTYPFMELGRMFAKNFQITNWLEHETGRFCIDQVCSHFDSNIAKYLEKHKGISAVYAYEDCAFETFKRAKKLGIKCIYDLPIAYWEYGTRLMKEEAERLPEWAVTLGGGIKDSDKKHKRKDRELELADVIVCPSSFVKNSLPEWSKGKMIIESPFGTPDVYVPQKKENSFDRPLRILFVGSMGQRKGLGDLFNAIKLLNNKNVELVVLGSLLAPIDFYKSQLPDFIYEPVRPHHQVLELMRTCDVFCFPSIVEGRALVMQEAMSQGLPLIITTNTGGEDLVIEGDTGFLVPVRSPFAIAEKINWFVEHRNLIPDMSEKAKKHTSSYTWEKYGDTIISMLQHYIENET